MQFAHYGTKNNKKGQTKYVVCIKEKEQVQNCHTETS